jgi:hypothetical protein
LILLARVCERLTAERVEFCVIGAAAMAVHGVVRATADLDLFTVDTRPLREEFWTSSVSDVELEIRRADVDDPLGGVVRVGKRTGECIDLVVGRPSWHRDVLANAQSTRILDLDIPVATVRDLVALKLYAGGPQDAWDIHQLLDVDPDVTDAMDGFVDRLPTDARELWAKLRSERT